MKKIEFDITFGDVALMWQKLQKEGYSVNEILEMKVCETKARVL